MIFLLCFVCPLTLSHIHVSCDTELFKCLLMVCLVRKQFATENTYIHTVLPMFVILLQPLSRNNFSLLREHKSGHEGYTCWLCSSLWQHAATGDSLLPQILQGKSFGSLLLFDLQLGKTTCHETECKAWILPSSNLRYYS